MKLLPLLLAAPCLLAQGPPASAAPQAQDPFDPLLLPQAVVLPRGDTKITIDGTLSDWPELPAIRLDDGRQVSGTAPYAWTGPNDCSAIVFLMWDEQDLYIACAVKDDWHRPLDARSLNLSEIPIADSVLFEFDPDRNTRSDGPDPGRQEDRGFWLGDESGHQVLEWDRLRGTAQVLPAEAARMVVLHDKEQGITNYEAKIPWSEILPVGRKVEAGLVMDMQIVVSDFDEVTDPMPQTRIGWTFGCAPVIDPGLFGTIMLVGDREALQGRMPQFPPKPATSAPPAQPKSYWDDLTARLEKVPPAVCDGKHAPEEAGGVKRMKVLEEIDAACEQFPRVDYVEFNQRIHRRMPRELSGTMARGLPSWWNERLKSVSKRAEEPVPNETLRLFRLPMGGWLFATPTGGFLVDPAGADVAGWLWGRSEFCLLTQPLDMTRRNDQLLLRMMKSSSTRPVLTHIAFHLPMISMADMPLVDPGTSFGPPAGIQFKALGSKRADGAVEGTCSYRLDLPNGPHVLLLAPTLQIDDTGEGEVDLMIASPGNPKLPEIANKVSPGLIVIDDTFRCQSLPRVPRFSLQSLYSLQKFLQPHPSILLAPGESWDITTKH